MLVTCAPTRCARDKLVARLASETGRAVRAESLRVGFCGGLRLRNLAIAQLEAPGRPWLEVVELKLDLNLLDLISGQLDPRQVEAHGVILRIERDRSGRLALGDLLRRRAPRPATIGWHGHDDVDRPPVAYRISGGRIELSDARTGGRMTLEGLEAQGTWRPSQVAITGLRGTVDGGAFELAAHLDRGPGTPTFEAQLDLRHAELRPGAEALAYVVPVLSGSALGGRLELTAYVRGQGETTADIEQSLVGQGTVSINPLSLENSRLVAELSRLDLVPHNGRFGSVRGEFTIGGGRINTRGLDLRVGSAPVVLAGWTNFGGQVDYRILTEGLSSSLGQDFRGVRLDVPADLHDLVPLRLEGTLDHLVLTVDGVPIGADQTFDPAQLAKDKGRIREIGRRLRDRVLR
jgi:hypothetical protein